MLRRRGLDRGLVALAALVLASAAVRFLLSRGVDAPWIAPDEQLYGLLGRSLVEGNGLEILGEPVPYYSFVYPLFVGLPFVVGDVAAGVAGVQALQAFAMSGAAIPVYLWARPLANVRWALVAAALTVLIPGLAYSGLLMSEALYYPVAVLALWALAACLRAPTLARQALLLGAIALAVATRLQAVGFAGTIVVAVLLLCVAERSRAPARRLAPTLGVLAGVAIAWLGFRLVRGEGGAGGYAPLTEAAEYSVTDVARSIAWQAGALTLLTIGIPLVALGILAWTALRARETDAGVRVLVATAVAYLVVTVVEVGAFASRFVEHVTERQLLSVAPPVFVAFAVWLHRGLPRPQPAAALVTLGVAASALLLPLERVATRSAAADALSTIPLEKLRGELSQTSFETAYALGGAALLLIALLVPRRAAPVLAGVVALALVAVSVTASQELRDRSRVERAITFAGAPTNWIDASGAQNVTLLVTGDRLWPSVWQELFWNDSVARVVRLPEAESPGVVPNDVVSVDVDGRMSAAEGDDLGGGYLAAPAGVSFAGERLAAVPGSTDQPGMSLWRIDGAPRMTQRVLGLRPNGDLHGGESAVVGVFGCGPGRLEATLLGKEGRPTRILVDGTVAAERAIPNGAVWRPSVAAPASADGSGICTFEIESDGLVGSTRVEFVPSG